MSEEFLDKNRNKLIISNTKNNIIFSTNAESMNDDYNAKFCFDETTFNAIAEYLKGVSSDMWKGFSPKVANSIASDYCEYYDKKYESDGYIDISHNEIIIVKPNKDCPYMYKFNKRRMESFIYDLFKKVRKDGE